MRKTKILAVFGILLAMGITACNKSSTNKSSSSEEHKHSFGSWTEVTPATCTQDGVKERVCECGEKETGTITKLGHDFKNGTVVGDTSTCTANGKQTVKCARCDATQESDIKAHHRFGEETAVAAAAEGYVGYKTAECSVDHAKQIKIRALDGKLASGSTIKSGTPDGYMKLNTDGNEISWKFNVAGEKGLSGKLYQIGAMDAFSSNTTKTYAHTSSRSSTTVEKTEGNFRVTVNGARIDKSAMIDVTFEEMTAGGADSSALGDNYSPIALCEIGPCLLNPGDNTIVYRRIGSYNLVVSDLVFIGEEFTHQHQAADTWSKDASGHWHACVAPGCPQDNYKLDEAEHTWAADWAPVEGHEATCSAEGKESRTCSICGYVEERDTAKLDHSFLELKKFDADAEKGTIAATAYDCEVCQATVLEWSALDFDESSLVTQVVQENGVDVGVKMKTADKCDPTSSSAGGPCNPETVGTKYVYKLDIYEAVTDAVLSFKIKPYNSYGNPHIFATESGDYCPGYVDDGNGGYKMADNRYGLFVNGQFVELGEDPYGTDSSLKGKVAWFDFQAKFNLTKGVNTIEILCLGGYPADAIYSYRLNNMPTIDVGHRHKAGSAWLSDENEHWHECVAEGCEATDLKMNKGAHEFGEKYDEVAATCDEEGSYKQKCTVCEYERTVKVPALGHKIEDEAAAEYEAGEGYIATAAYNCENCQKSALRWSALDFDETLSKKTSKVKVNGSATENAVKTGDAENDGGQGNASPKVSEGNHYVYKVNVAADVAKAGLAFKILTRTSVQPVFKTVSNDGKRGNYYNAETEQFTAAPARYGLRVNGQEVYFDEAVLAKEGNAEGGKVLWFDFPVNSFALTAGVNTIDVYSMGGYSQQGILEFQLTGLPHVEVTHRHTLSAEWSSDETNHWKVCTGEGCPLSEGAHIQEAAHTFDAGVVTTEPTHNAAGVKTYTCSVCGYKKTEAIAKVAHEFQVGDADANGVSALTCACGGSGVQFNGFTGANAAYLDTADNNKVAKQSNFSWTISMPKAGRVELYINLKYSSGNGSNTFGDPSTYELKCGETNGAITFANNTAYNSVLSSSSLKYMKFGEVDVTEGEVTITFKYNCGGARLMTDTNVRLVYLAA